MQTLNIRARVDLTSCQLNEEETMSLCGIVKPMKERWRMRSGSPNERKTLKVGIMLPQEWEKGTIDPVEAYEHMTHIAQEAETLGFASVWLFDHFHTTTSPNPCDKMIFECWMSTAALARDTSRIRIGQMVTCNSFRNPALLAKMASTVDVLSHGRLDLVLSHHKTDG
jgi:hypothetical protein